MSAIPNFAEVPLAPQQATKATRADWEKLVAGNESELTWNTPEQIPVRALYSAEDLAEVDHLDTMPGLAPFVRGPYPTMYVQRPWTIRQYAGFSTAKEYRFRSGDSSRLRFRPFARDGRRRHGGSGD
jgi:methylmalonyl-CoA mutase